MVHDELINMNEFTCPYCNKILIISNKVDYQCCDNKQIHNINGIMTYVACGQVDSYENISEYIDFYENIYKIKRKSLYCRKYHIENRLNELIYYRKIDLTWNQRNQIYEIFKEIDLILKYINRNRKRIISINYLLRMILKMMELQYDNIPVTKSKRTLEYYDKYWGKIYFIEDKIRLIINK